MTSLLAAILLEVLKIAGWGVLIFVVVVGVWLSPIGKFMDEFQEFRRWKRERKQL